ncbi:MAG: helix-turn-helix transcriptional regulator [Planctomycetes bacterium]|nr:helix-turn-helix transcriptional regulator [Planctomycetota bacterium]
MKVAFRIDSSGGVIRARRQRARLSLQKLADRLGWDKSRLSKYENNRVAVSSEVIEQIAEALGILPEELALDCLKCRYEALNHSDSEPARLLEKLLESLRRMRSA